MNRRQFVGALFGLALLGAASISAQSIPPTDIRVLLFDNAHVRLEWTQQSEATQIYLYKIRSGSGNVMEFLGAYSVSPGFNSWSSGDDELTRHQAGDQYFIEEWIIAEDGQSNRRLGVYGPIHAIAQYWFPLMAA